jgi:hypothetical protein
LIRAGNHDDDNRAIAQNFDRVTRLDACGLGQLTLAERGVNGGHGITGEMQVACHRQSHGTDANKTDTSVARRIQTALCGFGRSFEVNGGGRSSCDHFLV